MGNPAAKDRSVYFYDRNSRVEVSVNFLGDRATGAMVRLEGDTEAGGWRYIGRDAHGWCVPSLLPDRDMILRILRWVEKS